MGLDGKDVEDYESTFFRAYEFHSFRINYLPQLDAQGQYQVKGGTYDVRLRDPDKKNLIIFTLVVLLIFSIYLLIHTKGQAAGAYTFMAAVLGFIGAFITIVNSQKLNAIKISIDGIEGVFGKADSKIKAQIRKNTSQGNHADTSEYTYHKKPRVTVQNVIMKVKSITGVYERSLFLTTLAIKSDTPVFEKLVSPSYEHYQFILDVEVGHLSDILNAAEKLCQGITGKAYDAMLIQNYIGADLNSLLTDLLPYIYARREIHIKRVHGRVDSLKQYRNGSIADGKLYAMKEETHDLLYEHLEYYCYKWYWTGPLMPVGFSYFHERVRGVYHVCGLALQQAAAAAQVQPEDVLPYLQIAARYHRLLQGTSANIDYQI
ncbi:hypothetical protein SAMN06297280_2472 [Arsukibacterium tuosuense]|uniref:Uncharacterized protein n=1 Tax=Arsukibacterium tuosuense TaxID=1323745 RepID=A0A285J0W9_9GAMM|nr:hypothetical protein [Arsukibacterium tuosuense]SNY53848.1 hypothetical protein SAMN06297280_2472 [Arsukibacterium tuosuense]